MKTTHRFLIFCLPSVIFVSCAVHSPKVLVEHVGQRKNGDTEYSVTLGSQTFTHDSSSGDISVYRNKDASVYVVRVGKDTRGTFAGGSVDHYYSVQGGEAVYLGVLKQSYFLDERRFEANVTRYQEVPGSELTR